MRPLLLLLQQRAAQRTDLQTQQDGEGSGGLAETPRVDTAQVTRPGSLTPARGYPAPGASEPPTQLKAEGVDSVPGSHNSSTTHVPSQGT